MRLQALNHLAAAVQAVSRCQRLRVLGSSALLVSFPELGEENGPLAVSYDADLLVEPCDETLAAVLDEALGEGSLFARREGYHAAILRDDITREMPPGWQERIIPLDIPGDAAAVAPEDILVMKLRVGREKDLTICRHLFAVGALASAALRVRLDQTPMREAEIVQVYRRLREVASGA